MSEFLETTIDKFTFRVATDRLYCREGLWLFRTQTQNGDRVRVGLTDYLQQHSGDVAFVTVKPKGTKLQAGDNLIDLETIKALVTLASPISGTIATVNDALELNPEVVNQSPFEKGWLAEIDTANWEADRASLLDAKAYLAVMRSQALEELARP